MQSLALAYSREDDTAARRLIDRLSEHLRVDPFVADIGPKSVLLASMLDAYPRAGLLLLSDNFLRNPNCVYGITTLLSRRPDVRCLRLSETLVEDEKVSDYYQKLLTELRAEVPPAPEGGLASPLQRYVLRVGELAASANDWTAQLRTDESLAYGDLLAGDESETVSMLRGYLRAGVQQEPSIVELGEDAGAKIVEEGSGSAERPLVDEARTSSVVPESLLVEQDDDVLEEDPPVLPTDADTQAEAYIKDAWTAYDRGEGDAGLSLLGAGKENLPDHPDVAYNYALMLALHTGLPEPALMELDQLLEEFHDHAGALFLSGELSLLGGDHESAYLDWIQLFDVDPLYPELNYRLGMLILDYLPSRKVEALAHLRRASHEEPANGDARYHYAMLLNQTQGKEKKAIKWLKRAIDASPEHAAAHYALATLLHGRRKLTAARNYYRTAVHLDSSYDTPDNQAAFAQKRKVKSSGSRQDKALARLHGKIRQLETDLEAERAAKTLPATKSATRSGVGQTVLISGATSGIGRATAVALAADGYRLILLGRRTERLDELRSELYDNYATESIAISVDLSQRASVQSALGNLSPDWQGVDILINNAGKAKGFGPIHEGDYAHWDEMIDVNLHGLLTLTREITPGMVERGRGMVINVCSTAGKEVYPGGNVYCATKHAVDALTHAMRLDLVKHGIRVGQICPAHVEETEFAVVRFDGDRERAKIYEDFQPLRSPDVAAAIRFMVNQPAHVNVLDMVVQGTQQASSTVVDRSGRAQFSSNPLEV